MRKDKEIYHLPIIISKQDMEMEKFYANFYNEEYWKLYNKKKNKEFNGSLWTVRQTYKDKAKKGNQRGDSLIPYRESL